MGLDPHDHVSKRRVLFEAPGTESVVVERDVPFESNGGVLAMDVYAPPGDSRFEPVPAVVLVAGYPDPGFQTRLGCRFKEMGSSVSWARLIAVSGMAAITYTNREPASDLRALLEALRRDGSPVRIDEGRIGLWASSGNVPLALSLLMRDAEVPIRCAALCYGYMLDLDGKHGVEQASGTFGFVNPCASRSPADLRADTPLFLARAGQDQCAGLNESLDRFVSRALELNLPVTLANHPSGAHAFDVFDDSESTRGIVRQILSFLTAHLVSPRIVRE